MDKGDKVYIFICVTTFLFMGFCTYVLTKSIEDFRTDYICTQMSNEQFFNSKMCEKYWDYRRDNMK